MWASVGSGWNHLSTLLTGTAVYGAIGYGLDRWFGTWPILFVIGAIVGYAASVYLIYIKSKQATQGSGKR
jgi:F0F1-type ATP synthase assembly protein I